MRFMMLMIPKGYESAAPGTMPDADARWASRCPASDNEVIEVRQVQEFSDFPPDVKEEVAKFPDLQSKSGQHRGS